MSGALDLTVAAARHSDGADPETLVGAAVDLWSAARHVGELLERLDSARTFGATLVEFELEERSQRHIVTVQAAGADDPEQLRTDPLWTVTGRVVAARLPALVGRQVVVHKINEPISASKNVRVLLWIEPADAALAPDGGGPPAPGQPQQDSEREGGGASTVTDASKGQSPAEPSGDTGEDAEPEPASSPDSTRRARRRDDETARTAAATRRVPVLARGEALGVGRNDLLIRAREIAHRQDLPMPARHDDLDPERIDRRLAELIHGWLDDVAAEKGDG